MANIVRDMLPRRYEQMVIDERVQWVRALMTRRTKVRKERGAALANIEAAERKIAAGNHDLAAAEHALKHSDEKAAARENIDTAKRKITAAKRERGAAQRALRVADDNLDAVASALGDFDPEDLRRAGATA